MSVKISSRIVRTGKTSSPCCASLSVVSCRRKKKATDRACLNELSNIQESLLSFVIHVDGEPIPDADVWSTERFQSWTADGSGNIKELAENGRGEGELQALHAWLVARQLTNSQIGIALINSDVCIAAFFYVAYDPRVHGTELVVRWKTGEKGRECPHVHIKMYEEISSDGYWPPYFVQMGKCRSLVGRIYFVVRLYSDALYGDVLPYGHRRRFSSCNLGARRTGSGEYVPTRRSA